MKKLTHACGAIVFLLLLYSCKKNYTCACSVKRVFYASDQKLHTVENGGSSTVYTQKLTKKQATAACTHEENAMQTSLTNWYTYNGSYTYKKGESLTATCALQ